MKAAIAWEQTVIDLDRDNRVVQASAFHRTRQYLRHRLPGLAEQRAVDQKACQIAMTPDTHFILDFHPEHDNVLIAGGCSGAPLQARSGFRRFRRRSRAPRMGNAGALPPRRPPRPLALGIPFRTLGILRNRAAAETADYAGTNCRRQRSANTPPRFMSSS